MPESYKQNISILLVEDNRGDARLIHEMLVDQKQKSSSSVVYSLHWVTSLKDAFAVISDSEFDIIMLDLSLSDSKGYATFISLKEKAGDTPIIVMSGLDDETVAVKAVKEGAQDYLVKGTVNSDLLVRSMLYAVERKKLELEKKKLISDLEDALSKVKTLKGLIPICASCKKIRDDEGYWNQVEVYVQNHSEAEFSHSYCPDCLEKLYPELVCEMK